jgi:UDP-glucuronate 4-epimerase
VFDTHSFDAVCHLAAQAGVRYSLENPGAYISSNIVAFTHLIEQVRHAGIKNFVYASSSAVYGKNTKIPFSTEDRTSSPISLYAATKKANELIATTYNHLFDIHTTGLRFFTVIGPYGRPDMAPMLFADAICTGTPIKVFNHGKMQRDFTYVGDVVEGVVRALETPNGNRIFNLGNNTPVELEHFIVCLETSLGKSAVKEYLDMQPGDVLATYADIDLTTAELGWKPTTSIEDSVRLFVEWYKEFYGSGGDLASQQK